MDAESDAALEELLTEDVLVAYARRFAEHQKALGAAAARARAAHMVTPSPQALRTLVAGPLRPLFFPAGAA